MFGRAPQMRQDSTTQDSSQRSTGRSFTSRPAPRGVSRTVLTCVVLASGAAFGTAAQNALQHLGLDFASIHNDLIAGHVAKARSAIAWWSWCMMGPAAFFVGPLSVALTRILAANWWRMRALRLAVTAAAVLGLAALGQLRPAPSTLAFTTSAALDLVVVAASTLLAAVGAHVLGRDLATSGSIWLPNLTFAPIAAAQPWRGGGSAVAGLPFLRFREPHPLAPGPFRFGRLGVVAGLAMAMFAAVSALGGASALINSARPGVVRDLVAARLPPAHVHSRARSLLLALLPVEPRNRVVMPPVALLDVPAPKPFDAPEPRQRAISASVGYGGAVFSESELTFTKGYTRRRAIQLAANMTTLPSIPQLTAAININRIRAASLRFTQDRRIRTVDTRSSGNNRRLADNRAHPAGHARVNHYADRHWRRDRRHFRDRYDNHMARADQPYRRF